MEQQLLIEGTESKINAELNKYRQELLAYMTHQTGNIPDRVAQVKHIEWLFKDNIKLDDAERCFDFFMAESKMSKSKFRVHWGLVMQRIGTWLAGRKIPAPITPKSVLTSIEQDSLDLAAMQKTIERGEMLFNSLSEDEQDKLIHAKVDDFLAGRYAHIYEKWTTEEISEKAIYEVTKDLASV